MREMSDEEKQEVATEQSENNELEQLKTELEETKDRALRALAEVENMRRRAQKDKEETIKYCINNFAKDVLRIYDNLKLAINCNAENSAVLEGVKMTMSELLNVLKSNGIVPMETDGKKFDPNFHQAMCEVESDKEIGTIVNVIQDGFMIKDRILRPALVEIAKQAENHDKN